MSPANIERAALEAVVGGRVTPTAQIPQSCQQAIAQIAQACQGLMQQKQGQMDMFGQIFQFMKEMKERKADGDGPPDKHGPPRRKSKAKG